jgi:succinoglycan biosynthesis transport protein ExoP
MPIEQDAVQQVSPNIVLSTIWRRKWLLLLVTISVSAPGAAYVASMTPYYDAQASLLVDIKRPDYSEQQSAGSGSSATDALSVNTQVDILRAASMGGAVVDRLDLVHVPEFRRLLDKPPSILIRYVHRLSTMLGINPDQPRPMSESEQRQLVVGMLLSKVSITNSGKSYLIDIRTRTGNPDLSASISNAYADAYLDFNRKLKTEAVLRANGLLDEQIAPLQDRVRKAENAVEKFRQENGLITNFASESHPGTAYGGTIADQQLAEVSTQLVAASGEVAQKDASLHAVQSLLRTGGIDALPQVVNSPLIQSLRQQEAELSSREASLGETALGNNPALQAAQAGAARVRQRIAGEVSKITSSLTNDLNAARVRQATLQQRVVQLQSEVAHQSQSGVSLIQLQSEAQATRKVYQDYLARFEQTSTQKALQQPEAELISPAETPVSKAGPARGQLLGLAVVGGLALASALALILERLRGGIRSPDQLESETGLYPLAFVPTARGSLRKVIGGSRASIYTESVSLVNNLLQFGEPRYRARVVLVTSASPQEGKTFLAASLAAGVGRDGGRALLMDCDLRRPSVLKSLRLAEPAKHSNSAHPGSKTQLIENVFPGLDILTFPPKSNGSCNTLDNAQIRLMISDARDRYDLIVLDAPPVLAFSDASVLASVTDGVIVAVRWGYTSSRTVANALKTLRAYNVRVIGAVVTQVRTRGLTDADGSHAQVYRNYATYAG